MIKNTKAHATVRMFSFLRPYVLSYSFGLFFYGGQMFFTSFIMSLMISGLTAAMLGSDGLGVGQTGGIFVGIFIGYFAILGFGTYQYVKSCEQSESDLKNYLFRCFVRTSVEDSAHSGEGIASINTDANLAVKIFGDGFIPFFSCVTSIIFSALVIFLVDIRLGVISLLIGFLAFLMQFRFTKPLETIAKERLSANRESVKILSNMISGAAILRVFNLQNKMLISFKRENDQMLRLSFREAFIAMGQNLFTTLQGWLTLGGVFGIGGYLVAIGRLELAALMLVPNMSMALSTGMAGIGSAWAGLQGPIAASMRVIERMEKGEDLDRQTKTYSHKAWNGDGTLRTNHLSFTYQGSDQDALQEITLEIPAPQMVAFVGASGSGKSTLLRTLIGLYQRGHLPMSIGNAHFDQTPITQWRNFFAYVDQSCKLFDMSIAENIALGNPRASREDVIEAAGNAMADKFITQLPQGYDTPCGEKGASLSGGQKQRIAIARALVRKAPILVFDEATSALDAESEEQIMGTIAKLRQHHTILITTHNLRNIEDADQIVVLQGGGIAEIGSHAQLLAQTGEYRRLLMMEEIVV